MPTEIKVCKKCEKQFAEEISLLWNYCPYCGGKLEKRVEYGRDD